MERIRPKSRTAESSETPEKRNSKKVRGRPFQPGNPGPPRGAKNKVTRLVEQLLDDEAEQITRTFIDAALAGDTSCLRLSIDRLLPRRNGRPVDIELPPVSSVDDAARAMATIFEEVSSGGITAAEASELTQVLNCYVDLLGLREFNARLDALELKTK